MTLDETYERILLGIDREKREHAIRLLKCLAFSRRPLLAKELAEILAIQFDTTIPMLDTSLRPGNADEAVLAACSTLVTTIKVDRYNHIDNYDGNYYDYPYNSRVVQFSHYSVKEFLTSGRLAESDKMDLSQYYISPESAHTILAQSCISTLLQPDSHVGDITDNFPLSKYAAQNWFHHAQCDGVASQIQDGMEHLFDPDRKHFAMWISVHDIGNRRNRRNPWGYSTKAKASPLYYAALCGVVSLVEYLVVTRQQDPNDSHGREGTPLHVAVVSGHTAIVRFLLEHTANVNVRDMDAAVGRGNPKIAQLLLSHGADENILDHRGDPPRHNEARSQKPDVVVLVELLLKGHADDMTARSLNPPIPTPLYSTMKPALLHVAARSGNFYVALWLLSHGADVNTLDSWGNSPLQVAVKSQKHDVVELLLKGGASVNVWCTGNATPLHEAADSGNCDIVRLLLNHGADVNALAHQEGSPLHKAVRSQNLDAVELLLKVGADVNIWNFQNRTPLHEAADSGNFDLVRLLLSHGADLNALDHQGDSSQQNEARSQKLDVVDLLLKGQADLNYRSLYNLNPTLLHVAARSGNLGVTQWLLNHGADVNTLDYKGDSPLCKAIQSQKHDVVELLLKRGADVDVWDFYNRTPLHEAAVSGNLDIMRLLLNHGADVNALDNLRVSPLYEALRFLKFDVVELLVKVGADVNVRNFRGATPLHEAAKSGNLDILRLLLGHGAEVNTFDHRGISPLRKPLQSQKLDIVNLLLEHGANANARNIHNSTLFHEAVESGNIDAMKLLLSHGADVNAVNYFGDSPLHKAFQSQNIDLVDSPVNIAGGGNNYWHNQNVMLPCRTSQQEIYATAQLLLGHGAGVNARGFCHRTPLHLASLEGSLDISRLLIEHGADIDAQDDEGQTPFSIALANGNRKLARLLSNDRAPEHEV